MRKSVVLSSGLLLGLWSNVAHAEVVEIDPTGNLPMAIAGLSAGDELVLGGGTYNLTSKLTVTVQGEPNNPIVIRAKAGEEPIITRPDANQNTINIEDSLYLELRGLEVEGGSHGIRLRNSSFITIEDCDIHDTADVAISANYSGNSYEGLVFRHNHIHHTSGTGEGMYLGCNDNACQMFDSLIEGNYIHHTNGPGVAQGDGIEIKEGSYNNVVRDNVIHDTKYPCILTYSTVGNGAPNIIERNVMWGCGDHAIQSAADAIIKNNIILGAAQDGIRGQQHQQGQPSNLHILHNTIVKATNDAVRVQDINGEVVIANNALYAQAGNAIRIGGNTSQLLVVGNVGTGGLNGVSAGFDGSGDIAADFLAASFSGSVPNDVFPSPGSLLIAAGSADEVTSVDFNGVDRAGIADVGAYAFDPDGNPGWVLAEDFKQLSGEGEGGGGTSGVGGSSGDGGGSVVGGAGGSGGTEGESSSGGNSNPPSGHRLDPVDDGCSMTTPGGYSSRQKPVGWLGLLLAAAALAAARRN